MPTELEQNQCRDAIFKAFYIDIFRMQKENKEMTAMEVQIRTEEQMRMMSPMVGRIETEFLNPLIKAIYGILLKYNKLPILDGLANVQIDINYTSPLTRSQKSSAISSIEQVIGFFQRSGISNLYPVYDNINFDECFKLFFELPRCTAKNTKHSSNRPTNKTTTQNGSDAANASYAGGSFTTIKI